MSDNAHQARRAAAELLTRIRSERRTLDDVLASTPSFAELEGADRGFARAMASVALRHLGRLHAGLAPFLDRPMETVTPEVRALLEIGAAQAWLLGTPVHAAVGETVAAAKAWDKARRGAGFLNAVLRKAAASPDPLANIPAEEAWPDWLCDVMRADLGPGGLAALTGLQMAEPDTHLTPKDAKTAGELAMRLGGKLLASGSVSLRTGDVTGLDGFDDGAWWVQDAAAALPARLVRAGPGLTVVDLCAAPGGKTMQLAATGADVFALDRSAPRRRLVGENLARTGLGERVALACAKGEDWSPPAPVDAVLVDAPCSALGTLRRHPEGAWIKTPDEIARYPEAQARLLRAGLAMLKPGGTLVYCVCSPLRIEGAGVVGQVLAAGGARREPVMPEEVPGFAAAVTPEGDLLTLPGGDFAHDAFYVARLAPAP